MRYLIEGLRGINEGQIVFCFSKGSKSPGVIKLVSEIKYEYLILAVRINSYSRN
ncbi:MAG: hypothetical protein FH761_08540 [Firmicutes bacterium]|nr:hypothetical protein [Bacillota bacterium]